MRAEVRYGILDCWTAGCNVIGCCTSNAIICVAVTICCVTYYVMRRSTFGIAHDLPRLIYAEDVIHPAALRGKIDLFHRACPAVCTLPVSASPYTKDSHAARTHHSHYHVERIEFIQFQVSSRGWFFLEPLCRVHSDLSRAFRNMLRMPATLAGC